MKRTWSTRRWIVDSHGECRLDPSYPDDPSPEGTGPLTPEKPNGPDGDTGPGSEDGAVPPMTPGSDFGLNQEDFQVARMLSRGAPHRKIGKRFDRSAKWVQRKLRGNELIGDVAHQLRNQHLITVVGKFVAGLPSALEVVIAKASDPEHPEQLAAARLLFSDGLKYHEQQRRELGDAHRLAQLEEALAELSESLRDGSSGL